MWRLRKSGVALGGLVVNAGTADPAALPPAQEPPQVAVADKKLEGGVIAQLGKLELSSDDELDDDEPDDDELDDDDGLDDDKVGDEVDKGVEEEDRGLDEEELSVAALELD
jgi:hypothetical protein